MTEWGCAFFFVTHCIGKGFDEITQYSQLLMNTTREILTKLQVEQSVVGWVIMSSRLILDLAGEFWKRDARDWY
jgi:hypothetical protein